MSPRFVAWMDSGQLNHTKLSTIPLLLTFVNVCCCSYDFCTAPMAVNVIGAL